ncbi:Ig domain-containing protein [Tatumella sp. UCD-D_suzukii]|uniref:Ig-like domain-containing protein n=1 Tax=Tatumella sp. UCD-D_suzukii TaxID=1408192 RepID=UPI0035270000
MTRAPAAVAVTGITVTPTTASVAVGQSVALTAALLPNNASNVGVTWASSDEKIATVTNTGRQVSASGVAAGNATITATSSDGSFVATSVVTVTAAQ